MGNEVTGVVDEKDANVIIIKGEDGIDTRYAKESDLLAIKGSKESIETAAAEAKTAHETAIVEANRVLDAEKSLKLQAEARVSSLEEQIAKGGGTAAELATAKAELVTAKTSSEELGNKYLELKRSTIVTTYNVPKETVESKDLAALELYEEALKAVIGSKNIGNFAVGAAPGGANPLEGKSPVELAREAYSQTK